MRGASAPGVRPLALVNLGCGTKAASGDQVMNFDWSVYLRIRRSKALTLLTRPLLSEARRQHLASMPNNVIAHDLSKGIPLPDASCAAVYSSHLLEHLDRDWVDGFLSEIRRVLIPNGIHRVAVPDLEKLVGAYMESLNRAASNSGAAAAHEATISDLLEQSVRRESYGASQQRPVARWVDRHVLGDARKRGETHQWMYDATSLAQVLSGAGFVEVTRRSFNDSDITGWKDYGLETESGHEYKPDSLYMECRKPMG